MRVRTIEDALRGLTPAEVVAAAADAAEKWQAHEPTSRALVGLVFPEVWSEYQFGDVDYHPWNALRDSIAERLGIVEQLRNLEYPGLAARLQGQGHRLSRAS